MCKDLTTCWCLARDATDKLQLFGVVVAEISHWHHVNFFKLMLGVYRQWRQNLPGYGLYIKIDSEKILFEKHRTFPLSFLLLWLRGTSHILICPKVLGRSDFNEHWWISYFSTDWGQIHSFSFLELCKTLTWNMLKCCKKTAQRSFPGFLLMCVHSIIAVAWNKPNGEFVEFPEKHLIIAHVNMWSDYARLETFCEYSVCLQMIIFFLFIQLLHSIQTF